MLMVKQGKGLLGQTVKVPNCYSHGHRFKQNKIMVEPVFVLVLSL